MGAFDQLPETVVNEATIAAFDAASAVFEPDERLVSGTPARRLSEQISELVAAVNTLQLSRVRRQFSWYEKFTGLDLKERVEFDLNIRAIHKEMVETTAAADRSRATLKQLKAEFPKLKHIHERQGRLIRETRAFLATATGDEFHVSRLKRRLANLEMIHTSNKLTAKQLKLSVRNLTSLIDRFTDVEQVLFPLWQQQALTVCQTPAKLDADPHTLNQFTTVHEKIVHSLVS